MSAGSIPAVGTISEIKMLYVPHFKKIPGVYSEKQARWDWVNQRPIRLCRIQLRNPPLLGKGDYTKIDSTKTRFKRFNRVSKASKFCGYVDLSQFDDYTKPIISENGLAQKFMEVLPIGFCFPVENFNRKGEVFTVKNQVRWFTITHVRRNYYGIRGFDLYNAVEVFSKRFEYVKGWGEIPKCNCLVYKRKSEDALVNTARPQGKIINRAFPWKAPPHVLYHDCVQCIDELIGEQYLNGFMFEEFHPIGLFAEDDEHLLEALKNDWRPMPGLSVHRTEYSFENHLLFTYGVYSDECPRAFREYEYIEGEDFNYPRLEKKRLELLERITRYVQRKKNDRLQKGTLSLKRSPGFVRSRLDRPIPNKKLGEFVLNVIVYPIEEEEIKIKRLGVSPTSYGTVMTNYIWYRVVCTENKQGMEEVSKLYQEKFGGECLFHTIFDEENRIHNRDVYRKYRDCPTPDEWAFYLECRKNDPDLKPIFTRRRGIIK